MLIASIIALTVLFFLALFQVALIFGAPLGNYAWGGQHKILPMQFRIGSITSIIIYAIFAALILSKSELWTIIHNETALSVGLWMTTTYLGLGVFLNAISRSKRERNLMTPVALVLAITFLIVTVS